MAREVRLRKPKWYDLFLAPGVQARLTLQVKNLARDEKNQEDIENDHQIVC
jgi:hypothetical protein